MNQDPRPPAVSFAGLSHQGLVRRENQDVIFLPQDRDPKSPLLFGLADGMGGAQGGEVAAKLALAALPEAFLGAEQPHRLEHSLAEAVRRANAAVYEKSRSEESLAGMGTTLVALALSEDGGLMANVGDSRLYLWRGGKLRQLSSDHSLVAEEVRRGGLSREQARTHAMRNVLTRALGVGPEVEVDFGPVDPLPGDWFLLCSDGLHGPLEDRAIGAVLAQGGDPPELCRQLVEAANRAGGPDNISVVLIRIDDPGLSAGSKRPKGRFWPRLGGFWNRREKG